jgi:hypothetical protein
MLWPRHKEVMAIKRGFSSSEHLKAYEYAGLVQIAEEVLRYSKHYGLFIEICVLIMCSTTSTQFYDWVDAEFLSFRRFFEGLQDGTHAWYMRSGYHAVIYFHCHRDNKILMDWIRDHDEEIWKKVLEVRRENAAANAKWRREYSTSVSMTGCYKADTPPHFTLFKHWRPEGEKVNVLPRTKGVFQYIINSGVTINWNDHIKPALLGNDRQFLQNIFSRALPIDLDSAGCGGRLIRHGDIATAILAIEGGYYSITCALQDIAQLQSCTYIDKVFRLDWVVLMHMMLDYIQDRGILLDKDDRCEYFNSPVVLGPSESHQRLKSRLTDPNHPGFVENIVDLKLCKTLFSD